MPNVLGKSTDLAGRHDRRRIARFPIAGATSFEWKASDGKWHEASGVTRDIGKDGAFVSCDSPPPVASLLKLVVTLPSDSGLQGPVRLRGTGEVRHVRLDAMPERGCGACVEFGLDLPWLAGRLQ